MTAHITTTGSIERRLNKRTNPVIVAPRSSNNVYHKPIVTEDGVEPACGSRRAESGGYRVESRDILDSRTRFSPCKRCEFDTQANFSCPDCGHSILESVGDGIFECENCGKRVKEVAHDE